MKLPRRAFLQLAAVAAVPRFAWAQAYPIRPVRTIVGLAAGGELGAHGRLLLRGQHGHRMAGGVPRRAQEIEDIPGLDAEVAGELLNLDTASRCSYE